MLNLQLDIQADTAQRLQKILSSLQDPEVFAQNFIEYQISELRKGLLNLRLDLKPFEETYQITSQEFYNRFEAGVYDDCEDYIIWAGLYEMFCDGEKRLQELT